MDAQLGALRGEHPEIVAVRAQVARLLARQRGARRPAPVLILGETGTGKGLLARTIHQAGPRQAGPFVDVNCAAIPEPLLEAELFGYERGAFTDARQSKPGLFQTAHGGTLFLDEIGLLPAALQGKLLTVLEDRAVRRLGSTRAEALDVALVAATSVDLKRAIGEGRFREDLYHRLAVISLELPPLRSRGSDIGSLADVFLARACADYGRAPCTLAPDARDLLHAYRWPGNVRELANAMERVALLSETDHITAAMFAFLIGGPGPTSTLPRTGAADPLAAAGSLDDTVRARIEAALRESGGNIRRTAAALGISRNTLRARMNRYGLRHHESPRPPSPRRGRAAPCPAEPALPVEWERRHLSFLRARLLPSSAIDGGRLLEMAGEKVRSFGGRPEDSSPTGLVAIFGLEPVDNAPSHAVLAGLAIQNALVRARASGSDAPDVVIGIHCGDHLVGRQDASVQVGVDGKAATWSVLERLVAADAPGAIFISDAVVAFARRRFTLARLRDAHPHAWRVLRRDDGPGGGSGTRFVGRTAELESLRAASARAAQRHGQIVGVLGEAGVGKSRLLQEAARQLHGWLILAAGGAPYAKNTSYFPVIELLKSFCQIQDADTAPEIREKVTRMLPPAAGEPDRVLPPVLDLLGALPADDAFRQADPPQRRQRTVAALKQVVLAASAIRPLCLIVEDLHWVDSESQAWLDLLAESLPGSRVLLLVNYRPEYQHGWGSRLCYTQIRLDPLPAEGVEQLLATLLGTDPSLGELKRVLAERTEGNPFFIEECVRSVVETHVLAGEGGAYRLAQALTEIHVPSTVQAILATRIDRLPTEDKRVLHSAAVIGKDVPFDLLQAITALPQDDLCHALARLQASEFIYETHLSPDPEYTFKHTLTHEVAYQGLRQERRRELHARIVAAIESLHRDRLGEQIDRLAYHAVRGEVWDKALRYCSQAGTKAEGRAANRKVVAFFEQALAALEQLPETRETRELAVDLLVGLRNALQALGEFSRGLESLRHAERLADALSDRPRLLEIAATLTGYFWAVAEQDQALEAAQRTLALATDLNDPGLQALGRRLTARILHVRGDYRLAIDMFRQGGEVLTGDQAGVDFRLQFGTVPSVKSPWVLRPDSCFSRANLALSLAEVGEFVEAVIRGEEAGQIAENIERPYSRIVACVGLGGVWLRQGEFEKALTVLDSGLSLWEQVQIPVQFPWIAAPWAYVSALSGRVAQARPVLDQAVERAAAMRMLVCQSQRIAWLGEVSLLDGRGDDARRLGERALDLARQYQERGHEAWALWLLGKIHTTGGAASGRQAENSYGEALTIAAELGMRPLVAHCHLGLGKLYRRTGKRQETQEHLTTATVMYREMDMRFWLEQAEAELGGRAAG
jgi:DNA-binding NtrC family response regulator/tetratricopeptide (TPR) repeat protein